MKIDSNNYFRDYFYAFKVEHFFLTLSNRSKNFFGGHFKSLELLLFNVRLDN